MRIIHYCCELCGEFYDFVIAVRNPTKCPQCAGALCARENNRRKTGIKGKFCELVIKNRL